MKKLGFYVACLVLVLTPSLAAQAQQPDRATKAKGNADTRFLMHAAEDNLAEVQLGTLAKERGSADDVKRFGERMATDHQKAYDDLQKVAQGKGVTLPSQPGSAAKKEYDKLAKLSGQAFDRAYMKAMARDHDKDVKAFQRESSKGKDADVKDWAAKTLPTLQEHRTLAHDVAAQTGAKTGAKSKKSTAPSASPSTSGSSKY